MIEKITAAKKLNTYALIKASWLTKNFISSFEPLIITLINKKLYEEINVENLCKDFQSEYGITLPGFPCVNILSEIQKKGYIKYVRERKNWIPVLEKCSSVDITSKSSSIYNSYNTLKNDFITFAKKKYNIVLSDKDADIWIENYVRINSTEIFQGSVKEKSNEVESIKITADYILFLIKEKNDNLELFKKIAIGKLIVDALELNDTTKNLKNVTFYLDTRFVLFFIGFYGDFRQNTYKNLLIKLNEKGAHLKIFSHTKQEIMNILTTCEKWLDSPNYNPELSSSAMRYLRMKGLNSNFVRDIIVSLDRKYSEYNIVEDKKTYEDYNEKYQIDSKKLEDDIEKCYSSSGVILNEAVKETIGYDIKSIEFIYYIRGSENVQKYNETKAVLLTTNRNLVYASKIFSKKYYGNAFPACLSDVTIGTIVWAHSGIRYCDDLIESKLMSDCSASLEISQQSINKFCSVIDKMGDSQLLTDSEIVALKSYGLCTEAAKPKLYSLNDFEEKDIHEIMNEIRESTIIEEKEKHSKEVDALNHNIDELEEENRTLRNKKDELELLKKNEQDKKNIMKMKVEKDKEKFDSTIKILPICINLVFNILVQILLFLPIFQGIWTLVIRIIVPVVSFILSLIFQFEKLGIKKSLKNKFIKKKIKKYKLDDINELYNEFIDE
jgi:hypothetical protein